MYAPRNPGLIEKVSPCRRLAVLEKRRAVVGAAGGAVTAAPAYTDAGLGAPSTREELGGLLAAVASDGEALGRLRALLCAAEAPADLGPALVELGAVRHRRYGAHWVAPGHALKYE
eukprot:SAG31_NODE_909_length_11079_cov_176.706102_7_plen_116_part_00